MICLDYVQRTSIDLIKEDDSILKNTRSRLYPVETITDTDYADDLALPANISDKAESRLHSLEQIGRSIDFYVNADKIAFMYLKQDGAKSLKSVDQFPYLSSNISSIESNIKIRIGMARTAIDRLSIIWKSDSSDKIKRDFIQAVAVLILLYGCTT